MKKITLPALLLALTSLAAGRVLLLHTADAAQSAVAPNAAPAADAAVTPIAFPDTSLSNWQERSFVGNTEYDIVDDHGVAVLRGRTDGQASVLYRKKQIDLTETPWLKWSWKVSRIYSDIDEQARSGDDYPARLYVVAKTGLFPWNILSINYVWSSTSPIDSDWKNPYSDKAAMIAVQSGQAQVGNWTEQRRNVAEDFQRVFGQRVNRIQGFAIMVDGDNTGQMATAWFGNIEFTRQ